MVKPFARALTIAMGIISHHTIWPPTGVTIQLKTRFAPIWKPQTRTRVDAPLNPIAVMTQHAWSRDFTGGGQFATADAQTKRVGSTSKHPPGQAARSKLLKGNTWPGHGISRDGFAGAARRRMRSCTHVLRVILQRRRSGEAVPPEGGQFATADAQTKRVGSTSKHPPGQAARSKLS